MKYSKRQRTGLQKSIKKWEDIVARIEEDRGPLNCALCRLYYDAGCGSCPVFLKTNEVCCDGSPYEKWLEYCGKHRAADGKFGYAVFNAHSKKLAQAEVDFLRSLLPDGVE